MIQRILILALAIFTLHLQGFSQITVTNATLPSPGDPWAFAVDSLTVLTGMTPPSSTAVTWDFNTGVGTNSHLENEFEYLEYVKDAVDGDVPDSFPNTNIILPFFGGEGYCVKGTSDIEVHGFHGDPFNLLGAEITAGFTDPVIIHNTPMTYGDVFSDYGEFYVEIDGSIIPNGQFPITVDSATILYQATIVDTVDAFGTLITPTGSYDVIRISRIEYRYTEIFAKAGFLGWTDVSNYSPDAGHDTLWTFIYKDANTSQNIVEIDMEWGNSYLYTTRTARWLRPANEVNNKNVTFIPGAVKIYPNPAVNELNIEFSGLKAGDYTINVFSLLGQQLHSEQHSLMEDATIFFDTSDYPRGSYLMSVQNDAGKVLSTKRLIIDKP